MFSITRPYSPISSQTLGLGSSAGLLGALNSSSGTKIQDLDAQQEKERNMDRFKR